MPIGNGPNGKAFVAFAGLALFWLCGVEAFSELRFANLRVFELDNVLLCKQMISPKFICLVLCE